MGDTPATVPSTFDVVVVGSLNLDLVVRTSRHPSPGETLHGSAYDEFAGGKGLNQAVAAARSGARVAIVGCIGDDEAGTRLRELVRSEGIDDSWLRVVDAPTGRALITVDDAGENTIVVVPGANAAVVVEDLPDAAVVLAQLEVPIETVATAFEVARARGATTVLNPAPGTELGDDVLASCSVLVPNEHELELLGGVDHLVGRVDHLVVTRGAAGATLETGDGAERIEPFAVTPVDTTGAGDAFCGALAARVALDGDVRAALRYAAAAGALATTVDGAVPSQPRLADVRSLLAR